MATMAEIEENYPAALASFREASGTVTMAQFEAAVRAFTAHMDAVWPVRRFADLVTATVPRGEEQR